TDLRSPLPAGNGFPEIRRTTSLSISMPKASAICCAIRLQPHVRLRRSFQRPRRSVLSWVLWGLAVGPVWVKTAFDTFASSAAFENGSAWMALTHGGSQDPCRAHEQSAQTGDDAIRGSKVGSPLPTTIQNQDLMSYQDGFSNNGTEPTGSSQPHYDD